MPGYCTVSSCFSNAKHYGRCITGCICMSKRQCTPVPQVNLSEL